MQIKIIFTHGNKLKANQGFLSLICSMILFLWMNLVLYLNLNLNFPMTVIKIVHRESYGDVVIHWQGIYCILCQDVLRSVYILRSAEDKNSVHCSFLHGSSRNLTYISIVRCFHCKTVPTLATIPWVTRDHMLLQVSNIILDDKNIIGLQQ